MVSEHRDEAAATAFFKQAIDANGFPGKVVMDKSGANYAGIENINMLLMLAGLICWLCRNYSEGSKPYLSVGKIILLKP